MQCAVILFLESNSVAFEPRPPLPPPRWDINSVDIYIDTSLTKQLPEMHSSLNKSLIGRKLFYKTFN